VTPVGRANRVANVAGVAFNVRRGVNPKVDAAEFLRSRGVDHSETTGRNFVHRMRRQVNELQIQLPIIQYEPREPAFDVTTHSPISR
jgi:hypothetical protein